MQTETSALNGWGDPSPWSIAPEVHEHLEKTVP